MTIPAGIESFENLGHLDSIRHVLKNARESIRKEVLRSNQHWIIGFKSSLAAVVAYVEMAGDEGEISPDQFAKANFKLKNLETRIGELRTLYEIDNKVVPEEIQKELLEELDVLPILTAVPH